MQKLLKSFATNTNSFAIKMDPNILLVAAAAALTSLELQERSKLKARRRFHVHPYLVDRNKCGRFATDFDDLMEHPNLFKKNFRMSPESFECLFKTLEPLLLPKKNTRLDAIPPKQKLAVVLEYFATGDLQTHLAYCYRISKQQLSKIVTIVCDAICIKLKSEVPTWNKRTLIDISEEFEKMWNFPNVIGAVDGKHVQIKAPPNSGSIFYNYKGFHSIVLLGVCDAHYRFTYLDVGAYGSEGDASIFTQSKFGKEVLDDNLDFPEDREVNCKRTPYFLLGDDAFPLKKRLMKPFNPKKAGQHEKVFNYRLSRARRCIENAFGILSSRWMCLRRSLLCSPSNAQKIVSACCLLHNFLLQTDIDVYENCSDSVENQVNVMSQLVSYSGRSSDFAKEIRNHLKDYFNSEEGSIPWQNSSAFV